MSTQISEQPPNDPASQARSRPESPPPSHWSTPPEMELEDRIRHYRAYINSNQHPDCKWLRRFFEESRPSPGADFQIRVYSAHDGMESLEKGDIGSNVLALKDTLSTGKVKAVILSYCAVWNLDRGLLAILGSAFQVDPSFLRRHLDYLGCAEREKYFMPETAIEWVKNKEMGNLGAHLPSDTSSGAFETGTQSRCMSAWLYGDAAVFFVRQDWLPLASSEHTYRYLNELDKSALTKSSDWIQFIRVYVYLLLKDYQSQIAFSVERHVLRREFQSTHLEFRSMLELQMELQKFRTTLSNFITAHKIQPETISQLQTLRGDSDQLVLRVEAAIKTYTQLRKSQILNEQLQETRESKQASISVNRLTKLAFVFIPLNFVCALFSANLSILGDGVSLWVFAVAAIVAVILTILPVSGSIISYVKATKPIFSNLLLASYLFWHSPRAGVYYALFFLSHDADTSARLQIKVFEFFDRWTPFQHGVGIYF